MAWFGLAKPHPGQSLPLKFSPILSKMPSDQWGSFWLELFSCIMNVYLSVVIGLADVFQPGTCNVSQNQNWGVHPQQASALGTSLSMENLAARRAGKQQSPKAAVWNIQAGSGHQKHANE